METITYIEMGYREFENIVYKEFGKRYDFVADIKCGNDSDHTYQILKKEPLDSFENAAFQDFLITGRGDFLAQTLLQELVNRDVLQPGNYLIEVCW